MPISPVIPVVFLVFKIMATVVGINRCRADLEFVSIEVSVVLIQGSDANIAKLQALSQVFDVRLDGHDDWFME